MKPTVVPAGEGRRLNVLGDSQLVRLTGADTGGAFNLVELERLEKHLTKRDE